MARYGIDAYTWASIGAVDAEHYYAKAWCSDDGYDEWELEHVLTKKQAYYLNKKDDCGFDWYKEGDMSNRFDAEEDAINCGIAFLKEKFGEDIQIEKGSSSYRDNPTIYDGVG